MHERRPIIGVMGGGSASPEVEETAYRLGGEIARRGWILLNGGRAAGVMDASARGAHEAGGLVVGILPTRDLAGASAYLDIPIRTGMGDARNAINVLSSDVVIALPGGTGTLSEVALALKNGKPVVLLGFDPGPAVEALAGPGRLFGVRSVEQAAEKAEQLLARDRA